MCKKKGAGTHYIWESARSTYERGWSTWEMQLPYLRDSHPGGAGASDSEDTFCIRILRTEPFPLLKQVSEAIDIARVEG